MFELGKIQRIAKMTFMRFGTAVPNGSHMWRGRMIKDSKYIEYYVTEDKKRYAREEWYKEVEKIIEEDDLCQELDWAYETVKGHAWLKNNKERRESAMERVAIEAKKEFSRFQ